MTKSRIQDENYYQISGFMINRLGLKGVALSVYAIIYGFTQDGENEFTGSLQYLCDFTGGTSKPTIIKALKELVEKNYIIRREEIINNVQFNRYRVNLPLLKKIKWDSKENSAEVEKNFNGDSKETLLNNKRDNISFDNKDINNNILLEEFEILWKMYPRKKGKEKALSYYIKARKNKKHPASFEQVKQGIENYCAEIKEKKIEMQFVKHGSTWFYQCGWNDEYETTEQPQETKRYGGTYI